MIENSISTIKSRTPFRTKITRATLKKFRTISDFGFTASRYFIWDTELTGFALRIYPSGKRSYVIRYRNSQQKEKLLAIGPADKIPLEKARELARIRFGEILMGADPIEERRKESKGELFKDFSKHFLEEYSKVRKKSWSEDKRRLDNYLVPHFGSNQLKRISKNQIRTFHLETGKHSKIEANRCLALLSTMYNVARDWEILPKGFENPATGIRKYKEQDRSRILTQSEMARFLESVKEEANPFVKALFFSYAATGARKSELLNAKWSDLKVEEGVLELPDTKSGSRQHIYMHPLHIDLIYSLPRINENPYIFAGNNPGMALKSIDRAFARIRKRAGIENFRIHDLRRTYGSMLAQDGTSLYSVSKILRHQDTKVTETYAHLVDSEQKSIALKASEKILGMGSD